MTLIKLLTHRTLKVCFSSYVYLAVSHPIKSALRSEVEQHALLMEQREEENQQEIAKLKAEIKSLKLELFQMKSKLAEEKK